MTKGIYKRGDIYWLRFVGIDGKIIYESSGSTKFREAEALLLKRKQGIKEGKMPDVKRIVNFTFNELVPEYIKWSERQRSFNSKIYLIKQLGKTFGNLPLRRFNTMMVEQFQTDILKNGKKPATANRLLATLSHMFTKAVDWNMVESDTLNNIRKAKLLPENNKRLRFLSREECLELINCSEPHLKPIIITALNTGMRKTEILSLKWEHVDLKHGFILLEITKNGERREIPINDTLRDTFLRITRRIDIPYVFFNAKTGKHYKDVKQSFSTACKRAKINDFHFHDCRHTFASHLVMAGIDLTTVKDLLGHKTLTMTLRYSHLSPSHKVKAVDILDNCLNDKTNYTKTIQFAKQGEK